MNQLPPKSIKTKQKLEDESQTYNKDIIIRRKRRKFLNSSIKEEVSHIQHQHKNRIHPFNKDSFMQIKIQINIY